jgi:hypothetical protein
LRRDKVLGQRLDQHVLHGVAQFVEVGRQGHPAFGTELTVTVSRIIRRTPARVARQPAFFILARWPRGQHSDFGPNVGAGLAESHEAQNFGNAPHSPPSPRSRRRWCGCMDLCAVCFVSGDGVTEPGMCQFELVLPWAGRCHGDLDPPHADTDQRTQLRQLQPNRAGVASANCVCARPMRRNPQSNT